MCSYRVSLTVGHESEARAGSATGSGGGSAYYSGETHDWRLYVRGTGGEDISRFISKIVFTLHRSYTYPKRVIHEPPYEIRESGYGSFEIPIYIYIKHSTNPSKIKFRYKLFLQNHKPLSGSQKFSHIFNDPPEPVKTCLIEGGARIVEPKHKKVKGESKFTTSESEFESKTTVPDDLFEPKYNTKCGTDKGLYDPDYKVRCPEDLLESKYKSKIAEYLFDSNYKIKSPEELFVSNSKTSVPKDNIYDSKYNIPEDHIAKSDRSELKHKAKDQENLEGKYNTKFSDMDPVSKVLTVNLDRVSEEQLKRKNCENVSVDSKRRRTDKAEIAKYGDNKEFIIKRGAENKAMKNACDKIVDIINNTGKSGGKVRTTSKYGVKSEVKIKKLNELPQDKLTEGMVVDSLKKACKLVEMTSSEIDLVSELYLSLRKQEKGKHKLRLPAFTEAIYRPELPPSLRGLVPDIDDLDVLR